MKLEERYYAEKDYYEVLALQPDATCVEVQAAYDRLTQTISLANADPEARVRSAERMLELSQAYEVLNDPIQRSHYDIRTFGRHSLPIHAQVENLFREAIRAFRTRKTDMALHYFKEVSSLYPHRSLYRVHLAIAYADKNWTIFTEAELHTALKLDPEDQFAKETIAKLLFKLPDKKNPRTSPQLTFQVVGLASALVLVGMLLVLGVPQKLLGSASTKMSQATEEMLDPMKKAARKAGENIAEQKISSDLPEDMREELAQKQVTAASVNVPKLPDDFQPDGNAYDYTNQVAKKKTYYPDQGIVVVTYEDGSVLTYRPSQLKGWREDPKTKQAVMVTQDNELIPAPASVPMSLPDGSTLDPQQGNFPSGLFPEYGSAGTGSSAASTSSTPVTPPINPPTPQAPATTSGGYNPYAGAQ
jgi:tetratricopeptide (TPR) repeat protein